MYTLFHSNLSKFAGNLEGIHDEGKYKTSVQNMHRIGWKGNYFKSDDVSMLGHCCGVSQYPQFYYINKYIYIMLPRPYVENYSGENGHQFWKENWIIALARLV